MYGYVHMYMRTCTSNEQMAAQLLIKFCSLMFGLVFLLSASSHCITKPIGLIFGAIGKNKTQHSFFLLSFLLMLLFINKTQWLTLCISMNVCMCVYRTMQTHTRTHPHTFVLKGLSVFRGMFVGDFAEHKKTRLFREKIVLPLKEKTTRTNTHTFILVVAQKRWH